MHGLIETEDPQQVSLLGCDRPTSSGKVDFN